MTAIPATQTNEPQILETIFTVFTPSYNRAHTLFRLADSLEAQSFRAFEWLIVDDGSTDGTSALVDNLRERLTVSVQYHYKPNGGKHSASNFALPLARGKFFYTVDSDDALTPDALSTLNCAWLEIPDEDRDTFAGVVALCADQQGNVVGETFPSDPMDTNSAELSFRYGIVGEKSGFIRTDIMRSHPFPETHFRTYLPEGRIWLEIAKRHRLRAINRVVRLYYDDAGETISGLDRSRRAEGDMEYYGYLLSDQLKWFRFAPLEFLKAAILYNSARRMVSQMGTLTIPRRRLSVVSKALIAVGWPLSFVPLRWMSLIVRN